MQSGVSLATYEKDLNIIYGMIDFGPEREAARGSFKYIASDVNDIQRSYIRLGFHLDECKRCAYYNDFGYDKFEDFVSVNFGMDKSALSRCLNVFYEFAARNGNYSTGSRTMFLDERYKDFSYSQLCEMVSMSAKRRILVKPDMSVKEIRELKKRVIDVKPETILKFVECFKEYVNPFTREAVLDEMIRLGKSYSSSFGGSINYEMSPGKIRFGYSDCESYPFSVILDSYVENGGTFDEVVATSQPKYVDFSDSNFIEDLLYNCKSFVSATGLSVYKYNNPTGKVFSFQDDKGNVYKIQFSVIKQKEG